MGKLWVVPGLQPERQQTEAGERRPGSVETSWKETSVQPTWEIQKKSQGNTTRNAVWRHLGKRLLCSLPEKSTKHFTEKHKKNAVWRCWKRDHCSYLLRGWRNASLRVPFVKPPSSHRCGSPSRPSATTSQSADGQMIIVNCTPVTFPIGMPEYFVNFSVTALLAVAR